MIFESLNCTISPIASMKTSRCELKINMLFCYEFFENIWGFIFQSAQLRFESSVCKYFEDVGIDISYRVFSAVWYWFGEYRIAVKIKENKKAITSAEWWYKKSTNLISDYLSIDGLTTNVSVMSTKTGVSLHVEENDDKEGVSVSVTVLYMDMKSYNSLFFQMLWLGLVVEMVVSIFLLKWDFLVEWMLDRCACMWPLNVASKIGVYLVTWFTVNSGHDLIKPLLVYLHQVEIVG